MRARFWGVRGSIPVPGPTTNRYGGNTSCVEVVGRRHGADHHRRRHRHPPAGQGADAGGDSAPARGTAHMLISHTHWDHIQGLPFFSPLYHRRQPAARLRPPARRPTCARCSPRRPRRPYFPVPLRRDAGRRHLPRAGRRRSASRSARPRSLHPAQPSLDRHWPTASTSTARGWSTSRTRRRSPTSCSSRSSSAGRPRRARRPSRARRRRWPRCAPALVALCERRRPAHLRHPCSPPRSTGRSRTGATRRPTTPSRSRARRGSGTLALYHHAPDAHRRRAGRHPGQCRAALVGAALAAGRRLRGAGADRGWGGEAR